MESASKEPVAPTDGDSPRERPAFDSKALVPAARTGGQDLHARREQVNLRRGAVGEVRAENLWPKLMLITCAPLSIV